MKTLKGGCETFKALCLYSLRKTIVINVAFWTTAFIFLVWVNYTLRNELEGLVPIQKDHAMVFGGVQLAALTITLALIDGYAQLSLRRVIHFVWCGLVSAGLVGYWLDALLFQKTAIHLTIAAMLMFGSGWRQMFLAQEILGVRPYYFAGLILGGFTICCLLACLLSTTRRSFDRFHCRTRTDIVIAVVSLLILLSFGRELYDRRKSNSYRVWQEMSRVLPFSFGLPKLPSGILLSVGTLKPPPVTTHVALQNVSTDPLSMLPDIVLICVESMRGDFVTSEITPNLLRFKDDCLGFSDTVANSNASQTSWFGLFTSTFPVYYGMVSRQPRYWGSIPLKLLRQKGYQIHVLSSSPLNYHQADQMIFGARLELADSFVDARNIGDLSRPERDQLVTHMLLEKLEEGRGGRIFLVFCIAPHHDYYWPDDFAAPFQPVAELWNYYLNFDISEEELKKVKNRYKNSLRFIDDLAGKIIDYLKNRDRYDTTILFLTGDHGEEFREHGKLVHASQLYREQTHVPFLLKLPKTAFKLVPHRANPPLASHVDLLPTLIDYLGVDARLTEGEILNGVSLLRETDDTKVIVDDNGGRDPFQFCLQTNSLKAWFRFRSTATLIAFEETIFLTKITDAKDGPASFYGASELEILRKEFSPMLKRLFPNWLE